MKVSLQTFVLTLGINRKNKRHVKYYEVPSAIKPAPHVSDVPIPEPPGEITETECFSSAESDESEQDTWKAGKVSLFKSRNL